MGQIIVKVEEQQSTANSAGAYPRPITSGGPAEGKDRLCRHERRTGYSMMDGGGRQGVDEGDAEMAPVSRDPQRCLPASAPTAPAGPATGRAAGTPQLIPWSRHAALAANGIVCALARRWSR